MVEMNLELLEDLSPAKYNPRQISEDEFGKLKKGLAEFGMVEPIVANQDGTVIGGHQRLRAAIELGWTEAPVIRVDLPKQKEKALNLALNRLKGEWDYGKLTNLLTEFEDDVDFDIELTGFDVIEAADLTEVGEIDTNDLAGSFGDNLPPITTHTAPPKTNKPIIQYNIIFNDETEQQTWQGYLKRLKEEYPDMETISQRLVADISNRMQDG